MNLGGHEYPAHLLFSPTQWTEEPAAREPPVHSGPCLPLPHADSGGLRRGPRDPGALRDFHTTLMTAGGRRSTPWKPRTMELACFGPVPCSSCHDLELISTQ